ncbi:phage tail protein [Acinetobacter bereziniae]|uniref:TipJ family phage tail tip protein n=1 Tax=Acinetobacter bereziniae TaxID=106648 RepID=UPI0022EA91B2|nr:phage tail protein [Acinetobacter bereziniae]MDA3442626.1 phage tail protein [Acinetobacter bereziniae]
MLETVKGAKGGSQSQRQPKVANDTTASKTYARLQYGMSEGEVEGLANGYKSIYLDDTPVENDSGARNFQDVTLDFRSGTNDQTYMEGFESIASETAVGVELKSDTPWVKGVTNLTLDAVIVRVRFGALKQQDPKNGDVSGIVIDYTIEVQTDGGSWELMLDTQMSGKTSANYERTHRIGLPKANNNWLIRVTRKTPNSSSEYVSDKMYIQAITEVVDLKLAYPNTALIGVQYDAETFSNIAKIAVDLKGVKIKVPSNYDPVSLTYIGIWDGLFKRAYSNNPAWIYYDLCTNKRYALGNRLTETMIDKWSLYRLAQYCDQLVPDGKGGQEPRFTCNVYIQSAESAFDILSKLAGLFRAISYWDGASIVCEADLPQDTMFTYTSANIIDGAQGINYSGTRARDRHNAVKVAWDNPQNRYKTEYVFVRDEKSIAEARTVRLLELEAWGCTSEGQAQRTGQWALKTEQLETRTVTFKVGLDGYIPLPGKVIELADELLAGRANGGRISSVSADLKQITLDRDDVVCRAGDRLIVNGEDGKAQARVVQSKNGRVITVVSAFDSVAAQNVWVIDAQDLATMKFRVVSISQDEQHQFTITAIQHNESKFDAIDHGAFIDDRPISIINPTTQDPVESVSISSEQMVQQGMSVETMVISWPQAKGATKYQVEWRKDNGTWLKLPLTGNNSAEIAGIYAGKYEARVIAISAFDISSLPTYSNLTELTGKQGKPPKVAFIQATGILFGMKLDWSYPTNALDTAYVEIQVSPDSKSNIATLGSFAYPTTTTVIQGLQPNLTQFYRARLIDRIGNIGDWSDWTNGTTTSDAKDVLELLDGQITDSQLNQDLISRIEVGAEAKDLVVEVNKIATATSLQVEKLTNELTAETAQRRDETKALNDALTQETIQRREGIKALNEGLTQEITRSKDADQSQIETLDNYKASIDGSLSNVQTRISTIATATEANTSKLTALDSAMEGKADASIVQNLKNDVVTIGDQVKSQSSIITGLQNTVADKADASVVQNLKNDVVTIGDQVNSQSSLITGLQNTLVGKADASALTALDSKVETIDGNVKSQGQALTALENSIAGKADTSAVNQLKTAVEQQGNTISSQGQAITKVEAKVDNIAVGSRNLVRDAETWIGAGTGGNGIIPSISEDKKELTIVVEENNHNWYTNFWDIYQFADVQANCNENDDVIISFDFMITTGSVVKSPDVYWKDSMSYLPTQLVKGQELRYDKWYRFYHTRKFHESGGLAFHLGFSGCLGTYKIRRPIVEKGNIPTDWSVSDNDFATARAVQTLDAKVTTIGDKTNANAEAITDLRTSVNNKADSSALNSLKSTVEQQGNTLTSQGQAITSVTAQVGFTKNYTLTTIRNGFDPNGQYGLMNAKNEKLANLGRGLNIYVFNGYGDHVNTKHYDTYGVDTGEASYQIYVDMKNFLDSLAYGTFIAIVGADHLGSFSYSNASQVVDVRSVLKSQWGLADDYLVNWYGNNLPIVMTMKGAPQYSSVNAMFTSNTANDVWSKVFTFINGVPSEYGGSYDQRLINANATAVTKLDATVTRLDNEIKANASAVTGLQSAIDGKADANALNSLKTTVEQQGNSISSQGSALTQVEAKAELALNGRKFALDLSALDLNTYYPVLIPVASKGISEIAFEMPLGAFSAPWSSHGGGTFALSLHWKARASGWGAQDIERQVVNFSYLWTQSNQSPAMFLGQLTHSSQEFVFLRGGTWYELTCNQFTGEPKLVTTGRWEGDEYIEPRGYDASLVPLSINNKLNATATATTNLDAAVTQINGRVEANSQAITQVGTTVAGIPTGSGNLLINPDFSMGNTNGWQNSSYIYGYDINLVKEGNVNYPNYEAWYKPSMNSSMHVAGDQTGVVGYTELYQSIPVTGGKFYQISGYVQNHRCKTVLFAYFYDKNGAYITDSYTAQPDKSILVSSGGNTAQMLSDMHRLYQNVQAPSNAMTMAVVFRQQECGWEAYQFMSRAQACEVQRNNGDAAPVPWQDNTTANTALVQQSLQSINGIKAQYTVKTDVNGYVAGIGLINEGSGKSLFIIRADQFAIAAPASVGNEAKYAFNYQAGPVTLPNGTVVPAGLYLDNANIGYVSASKIYAESLSAVSANLGTFTSSNSNGTTTITGSYIEVKDNQNRVRVKIGVW